MSANYRFEDEVLKQLDYDTIRQLAEMYWLLDVFEIYESNHLFKMTVDAVAQEWNENTGGDWLSTILFNLPFAARNLCAGAE